MKTDTRQQILKFIENSGPLRVVQIVDRLQISPQAIHRHLKLLLEQGLVAKAGRPPLVLYSAPPKQLSFAFPEAGEEIEDFIEKEYLYVAPQGKIQPGLAGFRSWCLAIGQQDSYLTLAQAYLKTRRKYMPQQGEPIEASAKLKASLDQVWLDAVYYLDFWSLPQFGRTRCGHLLTLAKSGQHRQSIRELVSLSKVCLSNLIEGEKFDGIAFAPHSIPRKIPFLPNYEKGLEIQLPKISLLKALVDGVPVAQKSLSKTWERVKNARETIFVKDENLAAENVLLIDDALGSGATLNETAAKLKGKGVRRVVGFVLVGSLKGFEVLSEV